jgi:uncharacterized protein (DUF488 family)
MNISNHTHANSILTFGYGNRKEYRELLDYVEQFHVNYVVDVRLKPRAWSRKWYGDSLEKLCKSMNIQYISEKSLGNTSNSNHWTPPDENEAEKSLADISLLIHNGSILLLCAEMDSSKCHRVEVAHKLQELTGASVKHLK